MLEELQKQTQKFKSEKNIVESFVYLITEKGISYKELFGEELEIEFKNKLWKKIFGKIKITRKGIPITTIMQMFKFIEKIHKEQEKQMKKIKRK